MEISFIILFLFIFLEPGPKDQQIQEELANLELGRINIEDIEFGLDWEVHVKRQ